MRVPVLRLILFPALLALLPACGPEPPPTESTSPSTKKAPSIESRDSHNIVGFKNNIVTAGVVEKCLDRYLGYRRIECIHLDIRIKEVEVLKRNYTYGKTVRTISDIAIDYANDDKWSFLLERISIGEGKGTFEIIMENNYHQNEYVIYIGQRNVKQGGGGSQYTITREGDEYVISQESEYIY
jgi:hypothetical protein